MYSSTIRNNMKRKAQRETGNLLKSAGYTLVELAVVVLVVGIVLAAFFSSYEIYLNNQKVIKTESNLSHLTGAIGNFRAQYGRYPCPASLILPRNDPQYGRESLCTDDITVAVGTCDVGGGGTGYCVEQSAGTIDHDNDGATGMPPTPEINPRVRRGALPFRNLNLPEEYSYDGYGNRVTYVVTERLAVADTFQVNHGGISIVDDTPGEQSLLEVADKGHFLIFSPGENNAGAYNNNGVLVQACPNPALSAEGENCNINATDAKYVQTAMRTTNDNTRFDDRLSFFSQVELSLWQRTPANRNHIEQRPDGFVDFGDFAVKAADDITEVLGDVKAEDKIHTTDGICDSTGTLSSAGKCFGPSLIGGTGMMCPNGEYMVGIKDAAPDCEPFVSASCPEEGDFVTGVNDDGTLICSGKGCASKNHKFCDGVIDPLPSGPEGGTTTGSVSGVDFVCKSERWRPRSSADACCVPSTKVRTTECRPGFEGEIVKTTTITCFPRTKTKDTDESGCNCVGGPTTKEVSCPPEKPAGTKIIGGTFECPGGATKWGDPVFDDCHVPPVVYCSWQPINQTGTVQANSMPDPKAGSGCACGAANKSCFTVGIPGSSYDKHNCRCSVNQ